MLPNAETATANSLQPAARPPSGSGEPRRVAQPEARMSSSRDGARLLKDLSYFAPVCTVPDPTQTASKVLYNPSRPSPCFKRPHRSVGRRSRPPAPPPAPICLNSPLRLPPIRSERLRTVPLRHPHPPSPTPASLLLLVKTPVPSLPFPPSSSCSSLLA